MQQLAAAFKSKANLVAKNLWKVFVKSTKWQ